MRVVGAVVDQGALTFDFAIPCEIFGLDRSDIVDPWYEFLVVAAGDPRVRMQTGFTIDAPHTLDAPRRIREGPVLLGEREAREDDIGVREQRMLVRRLDDQSIEPA